MNHAASSPQPQPQPQQQQNSVEGDDFGDANTTDDTTTTGDNNEGETPVVDAAAAVIMIHNALEDLYQSTSYSVNTLPGRWMDESLAALQAPAHQSFFVLQHALAMQLKLKLRLFQGPEPAQSPQTQCPIIIKDNKNNEHGDTTMQALIATALWHCRHLLKPGFEYWVRDHPMTLCIVPMLTAREDNNNPPLFPEENNTPGTTHHQKPYHCNTIPLQLLQPGVLFLLQKQGKDPNDSKSHSSPTTALADAGWKPLTKALLSAAITGAGVVSSRTLVDRMVKTVQQSHPSQEPRRQQQSARAFHKDLLLLQDHLQLTLGTDLRDRAASDVALSLSLANRITTTTQDDEVADTTATTTDNTTTTIILNLLAHVAALELQRKSIRPSRKAADILYVVERIAAAGVKGTYANALYRVAAESLVGSQGFDRHTHGTTLQQLAQTNGQSFGLTTSPRALLCVFRRFSTLYPRMTEEDVACSVQLQDLLTQPPPPPLPIIHFDDEIHRPWVVDIGCGLGTSLLGLADFDTNSQPSSSMAGAVLDLDWSKCNYLGGDVNPRAIAWARSISTRWNLHGRLQFCHATAQVLLKYLQARTISESLLPQEAPDQSQQPLSESQAQQTETTRIKSVINIGLLVLQFPTPYRLQEDKDTGNIYLPSSPEDEKFMANKTMLMEIVNLMKRQRQQHAMDVSEENKEGRHPICHLLVQSNCEDVALYIHDTLLELGLIAVELAHYVVLPVTDASSCGNNANNSLSNDTQPKRDESARTKAWLEEQKRQQPDGPIRRAAGSVWSSIPLLPAMTETEVAMEHAGTPVHRCLFRLPD